MSETEVKKPRRRRPYGTSSTEGAAALSVHLSHAARERLFAIADTAQITAALVIERAVALYKPLPNEALVDLAPEASDRFRTFANVPQRIFEQAKSQAAMHGVPTRVYVDHAIFGLKLDDDGVPHGWEVADPSPTYSLLRH